jgi:hypothetical protein
LVVVVVMETHFLVVVVDVLSGPPPKMITPVSRRRGHTRRFHLLFSVAVGLLYANFLLLGPLLKTQVHELHAPTRATTTTTETIVSTHAPSALFIYQGSRLPDANDKLVFLGIFTVASNAKRRSLIRQSLLGFCGATTAASHRLSCPADVTWAFVMGQPSSPQDVSALATEQAQHNDLLILSCQENMNEGKTLFFFRQVSIKYAPHHVYVKVDDDTFVNLPDLVSTIRDLRPHAKPLYYGRAAGYSHKNFRVGWCYALSASVLAAVPDPPRNITGHEDRVAQAWVREAQARGLKVNEVHDKEGLYMYEHSPRKWGNWQRAFTHNRTVAVHPFKEDKEFLEAVEFFQGAGETVV